jgi:hypothetical protein
VKPATCYLLGRVCGEKQKNPSLWLWSVVLPRSVFTRHRTNTASFSGACWKKFMMLLEKVVVCGGVSCHPPPARPWSTKGLASICHLTCRRSARAASRKCTALSLISLSMPQLLVASKFARCLVISAALCAARHCFSSRVTLVSPLCYRTRSSHAALKKFEGVLGHELAVLHHGSPFGEGRREVKVGQMADGVVATGRSSFFGRRR